MKKIKLFKRESNLQPIQVVKSEDVYAAVFLKHQEFKERQSVYVSQKIHAKISQFVHVLALAGKDISVGGYIDNVLTEHLEIHKGDIAELYRSQLDQFP